MKKGVKRGQFQLSFEVLFSMILIAVFIFVAFYVIYQFLDINKKIETGIFIDDLDNKIERLWKTSGGKEKTLSVKLNEEGITHVCFFNFTSGKEGIWNEQYKDISRKSRASNNFYFYPRRFAQVDSAKINRIDMSSFEENPYCVPNNEGSFSFKLEKDITDNLVKISRG